MGGEDDESGNWFRDIFLSNMLFFHWTILIQLKSKTTINFSDTFTHFRCPIS